MNKLLFSAIVAGLTVGTLRAGKVTSRQASEYGVDFINIMAGDGHTLRNVEAKTDQYYMINFYPQGWAIIAADDCASPVVGYSASGSLTWHSMPDNMRFMLGEFSRMIEYKAEKGGLVDKNWRISADVVRSRAGNTVEPLIKVNWNQPAPYNKYCPGSGSNKALVGCVAVSMSQAMSVQRFPSAPTGKVSYSCAGYGTLQINFDEQRAYDWDAALSGVNSFDEAARLMYHAGMSVFMGYGTEGSGIPSNQIYRISDALVNNFGYSANDVKYYYRDQMNSAQWEQIVQNELYAGRAVIYNAIDPNVGGHSFNVDGIDQAGMYHLNWGWGGQSNGYFTLDNLSDPFMHFTEGHRIVIGVGSPNKILRSLDLSNRKFEEGLPAGSVLGTILVNGEVPTEGMELTIFNREGLEVPFRIDGSLIRSTRELTSSDRRTEMMVQCEYQGETLAQGFVITVEAAQPLASSTTLEYNRALGRFTIHTKHNVLYTLADANGAVISSGAIEPLPELTFMRDELSEGVNTLTLVCGDDRKVIRIVNSK